MTAIAITRPWSPPDWTKWLLWGGSLGLGLSLGGMLAVITSNLFEVDVQFVDDDFGTTQISGGVCPNIPSSFSGIVHEVTTEGELDTAYAAWVAGDAIRIMDNAGTTWTANKTFDRNGTADDPIYIIYETLHGFICNNCSKLNTVTGDYHVFAGFTYNNFTGRNYQFSNGATGNRIACNIFNDATDIFVHVSTPSEFSPGARDLEIDNNEFIAGGNVQLNINDCGGNSVQSWCTDAHNVNDFHIHHNLFFGPTVQEAIKLGLGGDAFVKGSTTLFNSDLVDAIVENNLFDGTSGDPEVISIKSSHNIIRNNCFRNLNDGIVVRLGHDNLIHGNYQDNSRGGARISGYRDYVLFNYFRSDGGDDPGFTLHNEIEEPAPGDTLNYFAAQDGVFEFNVLTGMDYMIQQFRKSPVDGTIREFPTGNTFQNNDYYTDSLVGDNDAGSYQDVDALYPEATFRANNTWGANNVTTTDFASSACGDATLFVGPGSTFNVPSTVLGGARTISAPSWWK